MEGDIITLQDVFIFDRKGLDDRGKVKGVHRATGLKPRCLDKLVSMGINVPDEYFRPE